MRLRSRQYAVARDREGSREVVSSTIVCGRSRSLRRNGCSFIFSRAAAGLLLFLFAGTTAFLTPAAAAGAKAGRGEANWEPGHALHQDHAVVAVTVDGHVHTLDAWTGNVRGVFADSGGPLVSSSTTIHGQRAGGRGKTNSEDDRTDADRDSSDESGGDSSNEGSERPHRHRRNPLGEGYVVPGLDGVIYSLGSDGRLSVLMSSAPDLVLQPQMACLAVSANSDGIVKDESCGLLIGEKTTELFSLDTETGEARRVGSGGSSRSSFTEPDPSSTTDSDPHHSNWADRGRPWTWGRRPQRSLSQLLLQRDEYVVRALDAATSEELWFVTVAHFNALDLEGRGGATALTRAKVAAADRAGYSRAVRARFGREEKDQEFIRALPPPELRLENDGDDDRGFDWETKALNGDEGQDRSGDDGSRRRGGGGRGRSEQQSWLRERFGQEHADRFPYLLYEENTWVVAMDPIDGSVLWRREMPSLAVSLYGIRGREWVDIMPPPMSLLQSQRRALSPADTDLMMHTSMDNARLNGEEVNWSHDPREPSLLLTNGGDSDSQFAVDDALILRADSLRLVNAGVSEELGDARDVLGRSTTGCSDEEIADGRCGSGSGDKKSTSLVSAPSKRPGAAKMSGLVQPGLRQGGQLQAQVGFMNGHFYVSSALRLGPLHAAAEDAISTVHDRYPHPIGKASRRSFVDWAGRDARAGGEEVRGDPDAMPPVQSPVPKLPTHPARPLNGGGRRTIVGKGGASVNSGSPTASAVGKSGGRTGISTKMGIEDWGRALLERLERDIQERKSSVGVEVPPNNEGLYMSWRVNEGLYMSWRVLACMAGLVSLIVAIVAYMAYKHGAEAMANMSNITRKGSLTVSRLSRANMASAAGARAESAANKGIFFGRLTSGRESPELPSPALHHGVSASSAVAGSRPWTPGVEGDNTPACEGGTPAGVLGTSQINSPREAVHIHRVQSLPALGRRQCPSTPRDRRDSKNVWKGLFGQEITSNGDGLVRAVSANTSPEKLNRAKDSAGSIEAGALSGSGKQTPGLTPVSGDIARYSHQAAAEGTLKGAAGIPLVSVKEVRGGSKSNEGSSAAGSPSSASSTSASVSSPRAEIREERRATRESGQSSRAGSDSVESGGSGRRRRRRESSRDEDRRPSTSRREDGHFSTEDGLDADTGGSRDERGRGGERRERKGSRSPRALVAQQEASAILLRSGGGLDDGQGSVGLDAGEDAPGALLVANRRLRTEFVEGSKLGKGGFGAVYKCRNRLDGHDYAVKKIRLSSDRRWQQQLAKVLREVKILALLDHPNIVRYYQAWLEKISEEDEQLLRAVPSVTDTNDNSALWDTSTAGGTGANRFKSGTTTNATNRNITRNIDYGSGSAYSRAPGSHGNGDAARDGYVGVYAPGDPLLVSGGGALHRSNANVGDGSPPNWQQQWQNSPPHAYPSEPRRRFASQLSEDLSVDGWSVDSRSMDDRGGGGVDDGGERATGGWRWRGAPARGGRRFDCDFHMEDEEVGEDDDASMGGFVFDREGDEEDGSNSNVEGIAVGNAEVSDGGTREGAAEAREDTFEGDWAKNDERNPSGSTAPLSSTTTSKACRNKNDTLSMYRTPECESRSEPPDSGIPEDGDGGIVVRSGEDDVYAEDPRRADELAKSDGDSDSGSDEEDEEDCVGSEHADDDSFSWNRVKPLPLSTAEPIANGYHHRARSTDAGTAIAATLASEQLEAAVGAVAGSAMPPGAAGDFADPNRRPRGKSWPQNVVARLAKEEASEAMALQRQRPGLPPEVGRRRRGRARRRRRVGGAREVYDLWLYIQMQYCSHNNLQYFLENSERPTKTRVDMPQVMHIFLQVAKGLQYVHACGLIHRDLKPANCFLMADGTVKIGDFGLSRHIAPANGINGEVVNPAEGSDVPVEAMAADHLGSASGDESITGGVGTYLYGSPEQMSGKPYDEKTDMYSLGMLLFEMCHPPFGTKMERTVVLTNAHRLIFPAGDVWGPAKGEESIKNLCRSMLQQAAVARPSAADIVRQVELMQGKHMLLQLDKKPPGGETGGRPDVAVVLRVEALEQEGLLHRFVDLIRALLKGQEGSDAGGPGDQGTAGDQGARLEQYGLRGHTGSAVMEFLIAGAAFEERETIITALENHPEVKSVREFSANG